MDRKTLTLTLAMTLSWGMYVTASEDQKTTEFQDWTLRCSTPPEAERESCHISQNLVLRESGQRLLNIVVGNSVDENKPTAVVTLPLGISLPPGISVQIDKREKMRFPIERCNQNGCIAAFVLSRDLIAGMKAGLQAQITFHDASRRGIVVPVSLKGFTAGFNALQ